MVEDWRTPDTLNLRPMVEELEGLLGSVSCRWALLVKLTLITAKAAVQFCDVVWLQRRLCRLLRS